MSTSDTSNELQPTGNELNIYQKLAKITGEIGVIKKGGVNKEQGYSFIEYAAVAGELRKLFSEHGVVIVPRMDRATKQQRSEITSKYGKIGYYVLIDFSFTIVNADDPSDKFTVTWTGEAADFGDKATNKAATSALKYYLMRQFNISEKGDDPDAETPEITPSAQPEYVPQSEPATSKSSGSLASAKQLGMMQAKFMALNIDERDDKIAYISKVIGRDVQSSTELTKAEGVKVIDRLISDVEAA